MIISIDATHSSYPDMQFSELRVSNQMTFNNFKRFLHSKTGTPPESMKIYIREGPSNTQVIDFQGDKIIADLGIVNNAQLYIEDTSNEPLFADDSVPRYTLPEDKNQKRKDNLKQVVSSLKRECALSIKLIDKRCSYEGKSAKILSFKAVAGETLLTLRCDMSSSSEAEIPRDIILPFSSLKSTIQMEDAKLASLVNQHFSSSGKMTFSEYRLTG